MIWKFSGNPIYIYIYYTQIFIFDWSSESFFHHLELCDQFLWISLESLDTRTVGRDDSDGGEIPSDSIRSIQCVHLGSLGQVCPVVLWQAGVISVLTGCSMLVVCRRHLIRSLGQVQGRSRAGLRTSSMRPIDAGSWWWATLLQIRGIARLRMVCHATGDQLWYD